MDLPLNSARPHIMHIDLNSCFAIIEQQANPLYRNKPLAVAAYDTPRGMVIASSYEAKALGIKLGVNVREARLLDPDVIILMPDPRKYRYAHTLFRQVLSDYTSLVHAKSIDEFIVDFSGSPALRKGKSLVEVGYEIKARIKEVLGGYVTVNIGIGTNRFWAKTAAGLNKPDGLDIMTSKNARQIYKKMSLTDLTGINVRYEARLNVGGIFTPTQFLDAPLPKLKQEIFHSIVGYYWYLRLRGWEIDNVVFGRKSIGHTHAIGQKTKDIEQLSKLLMKLCHKVGRRMRRQGYSATSIHLSLLFDNGQYWSRGRKTRSLMYSNRDIYVRAQRLLNQVGFPSPTTNLAVSVYGLVQSEPEQINLFQQTRLDSKSLADACDAINDKYGEFVITPALMMGMGDIVLDRIAFGSIKDYVD